MKQPRGKETEDSGFQLHRRKINVSVLPSEILPELLHLFYLKKKKKNYLYITIDFRTYFNLFNYIVYFSLFHWTNLNR